MPRNSAGTYTLPAGNPVATISVISSTWANTTLSDISTALTGSLARNGDGSMLAGLELFDGVIGAPGLTWGTETTAGFYRASAGNFRFAIGGADIFTITSAGISGSIALGLFGDGTAAVPSISFTLDPNTGLYRIGSDRLGISAGGVKVADFSNGASGNILLGGSSSANSSFAVNNLADTVNYFSIRGDGQAEFIDGTAAIPSISFLSDVDTGMYRVSADTIAFSAAGINRVVFNTVSFITRIQNLTIDGVVGAPAYTFESDPDTGMYRQGPNDIRIVAGGATRFIADATNTYSRVPMLFVGGTAVAPGVSFENDTDTGIYQTGPNELDFAAGGAQRMYVSGDGLYAKDGTAALPFYSFMSDGDTGVYRVGADDVGIAAGGVRAFHATSTQSFFKDGLAASPGLAFDNDPSTGIYRIGANNIGIAVGGVRKVDISAGTTYLPTANLQVDGIHNGTAPAGAANQYIASGTYLPTASASVNLDTVTPSNCNWTRVGNVCTVGGSITVDPTAAALASFEITLPIASNLSTSNHLNGVGVVNVGPPGSLVRIVPVIANNTAGFSFQATGTASTDLTFTFVYLVL